LKFGEEDPFALMERMPQRVFRLWQLFWQREPWGGFQDDLRFAKVLRVLDLTYRGGEAQAPHEFFPSLARFIPDEDAGVGIDEFCAAWGVAKD
jgi:hypothetical protein